MENSINAIPVNNQKKNKGSYLDPSRGSGYSTCKNDDDSSQLATDRVSDDNAYNNDDSSQLKKCIQSICDFLRESSPNARSVPGMGYWWICFEICSIAVRAFSCAAFDANITAWDTARSEFFLVDWVACFFFLASFIYMNYRSNLRGMCRTPGGCKYFGFQVVSLLIATFGIFTVFKMAFDEWGVDLGKPLFTSSGEECHVLQFSTIFANWLSLFGYLVVMFGFWKCNIKDPFRDFFRAKQSSDKKIDLSSLVAEAIKEMKNHEKEFFKKDIDLNLEKNKRTIYLWQAEAQTDPRSVAFEILKEMFDRLYRHSEETDDEKFEWSG